VARVFGGLSSPFRSFGGHRNPATACLRGEELILHRPDAEEFCAPPDPAAVKAIMVRYGLVAVMRD